MIEYASNNKKKQEQQENVAKLNKIVNANVKKRSEFSKFFSMFIADDLEKMKQYIIKDVIVAGIKSSIISIVEAVFDGGDIRRPSRRTDYNSISTSKVSSNRYNRERERERYYDTNDDYNDIEFDTRADAEAVLDEMDNVIEKFDVVRVSDFYDLIGKTCPYTLTKFGWTSLATARINRSRNGWYIAFPKAMPIR